MMQDFICGKVYSKNAKENKSLPNKETKIVCFLPVGCVYFQQSCIMYNCHTCIYRFSPACFRVCDDGVLDYTHTPENCKNVSVDELFAVSAAQSKSQTEEVINNFVS